MIKIIALVHSHRKYILTFLSILLNQTRIHDVFKAESGIFADMKPIHWF